MKIKEIVRIDGFKFTITEDEGVYKCTVDTPDTEGHMYLVGVSGCVDVLSALGKAVQETVKFLERE